MSRRPQTPGQQAVITNWVAYTPTWEDAGGDPAIGDGTLEGFWKRSGDTLEVKINIHMGSTTTYGGGSGWTLTIPTGLQIDTDKIPSNGGGFTVTGHAWCADGGTPANRVTGNVAYSSTTQVNIFRHAGSVVQATSPFTWTNNDNLELWFSVPIKGWGV